nr:response regulator [Deltaproteobacteria bacterium]
MTLFRSIKTKILASHIGLVLLVCGLLGISSYMLMVKSLKKTQEKYLENIARNQAEKLENLIQHMEERFRSIATADAIEAYSMEYHEPVLIQHFNSFIDEFPILAYVRQDGLEEMKLVKGRERPEQLADISHSFIYEEATWEPNKVIFHFPASGRGHPEMVAQFAYFRQNYFGEFVGLIVGEIPLASFLRNIGEFIFDETGFMILMDGKGTILSHPAQENIMQPLLGNDPRSNEVVSRAREMKSGFSRATLLGIEGFVAYFPVAGRNLTIMATLPYHSFMAPAYTMRNMVLAITLSVLLATVILSLLLSRGITMPILKLSHATSRLAKGDLQHTVDVRSKDEIGVLAASFNSMTRDLHEAIISRDKEIQERIRTEEERRKLEVRIQRAQKMELLGTLAGRVAHDLNNILGGIIGYPDLLLLSLPEESKMRKPLLAIKQSGEKASIIVQDLLTMARRAVVTSKTLNFNTIVEEYLKSPEHLNLLQNHAEITFDVQLGLKLLNISGSPIHLSKMVMNLVYNAAEALSGEGTIRITTGNIYVDKPFQGYDNVQEGEYVTFTVTDTGVGIAEEDLGKIFEPFYTKKVMGKSGTGLGMSVVWGTVKDHNGYINVQSHLGEGTSITVYLPVTRQQIEVDENKVSITDYQGNGESILVVDDVAEQREIAYQMLTQLGYKVATVASGEEAVAFFQENKADLLILDMIMNPGIDGLETYKRILQLQPKQKAIIVSGFFETKRVDEAEKMGIGSYVLKPYDLEKIALGVKTELSRLK